MNKIISISVWGNDPRYIVGAKRQASLAKKYFPEWKFYIYCDNKEHYKDVDATIIEVKDDTWGAFWRFEPFFESEDNIVLSRDADSRFTIREVSAINEWLLSDKKLHLIRDHEAHFGFPIMAGLFGIKGKLSQEVKNAMIAAMSNKAYLSDQIFLKDIVYPQLQDSCMIHTLESGWFKDTRSRMMNRFSFCGNGYDENDMPLYPPTLNECAGFDPKYVPIEYKFDEGFLYGD